MSLSTTRVPRDGFLPVLNEARARAIFREFVSRVPPRRSCRVRPWEIKMRREKLDFVVAPNGGGRRTVQLSLSVFRTNRMILFGQILPSRSAENDSIFI